MRRAVFIVFTGLFLLAARGPAALAAPADKPDEEEGKIAGTPIQRPHGWIGIEVKDNHFRMTFYDAKKKPVPADVSAAVLRWPVRYQPNDERTELVPTDSPSVLASEKTVKAPLTFKLRITLLSDAKAGPADPYGAKPEAGESYVIDFQG